MNDDNIENNFKTLNPKKQSVKTSSRGDSTRFRYRYQSTIQQNDDSTNQNNQLIDENFTFRHEKTVTLDQPPSHKLPSAYDYYSKSKNQTVTKNSTKQKAKAQENLKISGGLKEWLVTDIMKSNNNKRALKRFKQQQKEKEEELLKKIQDQQEAKLKEEASKAKLSDYIPFSKTFMSFFSRSKTTVMSTINENSEIHVDQQPSDFIVKKNTILGKDEEELPQDLVGLKFDQSQEYSARYHSKNNASGSKLNQDSDNESLTPGTILINPVRPLQDGIPPQELFNELDNVQKGKEKKKFKQRTHTRKMVQAPAEMWHLDSDLIEVNLDEFEAQNSKNDSNYSENSIEMNEIQNNFEYEQTESQYIIQDESSKKISKRIIKKNEAIETNKAGQRIQHQNFMQKAALPKLNSDLFELEENLHNNTGGQNYQEEEEIKNQTQINFMEAMSPDNLQQKFLLPDQKSTEQSFISRYAFQ